MTRTLCTAALFVAMVGGFPRAALPQNASPPESPARPAAYPSEDLEARVAKLEGELAKLRSRVTKHDRDLETIAKGTLDNTAAIERNTTDITSTRDQLARLAGRVDDTDAKLATIARIDPSTGRYVPNLLGNMQESRAFRQEFQNANRARVVIVNDSPVEKNVFINGVRWRAIPGRSFVPVAMAPVTVRTSSASDPLMLNRWRLDDRGYYVEFSLSGFTPHDAEPVVE